MSVVLDAFRRFIDGSPKRRRIQTGKDAGIAKVLVRDGSAHAGMGIVVDPRCVITCAHVVNAALERDESTADEPREDINVIFPMSREPVPFRAKIAGWRPSGLMPKDDIAVLSLASEIPEEVGIATLADISKASPDGDELSIFGLARGDFLGNHVAARFKGPTSAAWVQLNSVNTEFIEEGFSGSAVWNERQSAVLGMVVAKNAPGRQRVAYMIPSAELNEFWPKAPLENRSLAASFALSWTLFSAVYFVLLLAHWAWDRGMHAFSPITLAPNNQQLAAFWGMHIYAFLAPIPLLMLIRFARSFRLHDWYARIPSFGRIRLSPVSSSSWRTAVASILAFVVLPLAAQIHFIRQFHQDGFVYVYPTSFGYTSDDPVFADQKCCKRSVHLCTKSEVGRYSRAIARTGADTAYVDNAYHFGDCDRGEGSTVTYYPIIQPIVILALTALSAALSAIALFLIFRGRPNHLLRSNTNWKRNTDLT